MTYWIQASPPPWQCGSCQLCSPKRQSSCMVSWGRRQGKILLQQNFTDPDKVNFLRPQKCTFSEGIINSRNNYILSTAKTSEQPLALFYQRTTPWNVDHHHAQKTERPKPGRKKMGRKISVPFPLWRLQRLRGKKPRDPCRGCSNFLCDISTAACNSEPAMLQRNALHFTTATLETFHRRHLRFQMDDISYGELRFQLDDTSIQDLIWLIPSLRVLDGWDLHLGFQTDVTFVQAFLMDETIIYGFRLDVTLMFDDTLIYHLSWKFRWMGLHSGFWMDDIHLGFHVDFQLRI
jgi:hypothetical protein